MYVYCHTTEQMCCNSIIFATSKKHGKEEMKGPEFQTENVTLWCSTNKFHVNGSNMKLLLLLCLLDACCTLLCIAAQARLSVKELEYLWQKRTSNISLFKENTPFNYSTFLNQSVSKKNRQAESLLVMKSQEQTLHNRKSCFNSSRKPFWEMLLPAVKIAINILFPNFMKSPGIHLKSNFANDDQKMMNWKHFLRNNVKDNFAVLVLLFLAYSVTH